MPLKRNAGTWPLALLVLGFLCATDARAWEAPLPASDDAPYVAVDKSRQRLVLAGREAEYVCSTGSRPGDKRVRGDLKTPEGIYFIIGKRTSGLDFQEYGDVAYPLDYPNPVDRLRGKTGSGIWVHSRGRRITPYESHGCVVVNLDDMSNLRHRLQIGTPVIIAERLRPGNGAAASEATARVEARTRGWYEAWRAGGRAEGYYADSASGRALASRLHKERASRDRPGKADMGPVHVLEGPGYWVSWFSEGVAEPGGGTFSGIRRLYWQRDKDGVLRIVGARWEAAQRCGEVRSLEQGVRGGDDEGKRTAPYF